MYEPIPDWLREAQRRRRQMRCECVVPEPHRIQHDIRCARCGGWLPAPLRTIQPSPNMLPRMPRRPKQHPYSNAYFIDPEPPPRPLTIIGEWLMYLFAIIAIVWSLIVWTSL